MTRSGKHVHFLALALASSLLLMSFACTPASSKGGSSSGGGQGAAEPQETTTPLRKERLNINENGKVAGDEAELGRFKSFYDAAEAFVASRTEMKGENDFLLSGIKQAADGGDEWVSAQVSPVQGGDTLYILLRGKGGVWTGVYLGSEQDSSLAPESVRSELFDSK